MNVRGKAHWLQYSFFSSSLIVKFLFFMAFLPYIPKEVTPPCFLIFLLSSSAANPPSSSWQSALASRTVPCRISSKGGRNSPWKRCATSRLFLRIVHLTIFFQSTAAGAVYHSFLFLPSCYWEEYHDSGNLSNFLMVTFWLLNFRIYAIYLRITSNAPE